MPVSIKTVGEAFRVTEMLPQFGLAVATENGIRTKAHRKAQYRNKSQRCL
jgi:translation initiation factor IF-1